MKDSDDKLENIFFSMVLPPMSLTKPDRLGDFERVGKGPFAGLHVMKREGKTEWPVSKINDIAADAVKSWYARYGEQMAGSPPRPRVFFKAPADNSESLQKARETLAKNRAEERALTQPVETAAATTAPSRPRAKRTKAE